MSEADRRTELSLELTSELSAELETSFGPHLAVVARLVGPEHGALAQGQHEPSLGRLALLRARRHVGENRYPQMILKSPSH